MSLRVDLEALAHAITHASAQGDDLAIAHTVSDNRLAAAQPGWAGDSAVAMAAKMDVWLATSKTLLTRMGEHALGLSNDAIKFTAMEQRHADMLRAVGECTDEAAGVARG